MTRIGSFGTKVLSACAGLGLSWLAGCDGSGVEPRTLTAADIQGMMMPGNAMGTAFSGTYATTAASIDGCRCRTGSCASFHPLPSSIAAIDQEDGVLTLNGDCVGGVNSDGTFWCAASESVPGGVNHGINTGSFTMSGGTPTGMQVTEEITLAQPIDGVLHDCDLRAHATARFVGGP
jgi:hypothetical protein